MRHTEEGGGPASRLRHHPYDHSRKHPANKVHFSGESQVHASPEDHDIPYTMLQQKQSAPTPLLGHDTVVIDAGFNARGANTPTRCKECRQMLDEMNSPVGNFVRGEIFQQAAKQMLKSMGVQTNPTKNIPKEDIVASKTSSRKPTDDQYCDACSCLESELRSTFRSQLQLAPMSQSSCQSSHESPDYIAFHGSAAEARQHQPIQNCAQCLSTEAQLRNSLFRDMRKSYANSQRQHISKDPSYAYKDGIPYAPFARQPITEAAFSSCANCTCSTNKDNSPCADQFQFQSLPSRSVGSERHWDPYALARLKRLPQYCWKCETRGIYNCGLCFP